MHVELIAITHYLGGEGGPEGLIEHAGRVCYRSQGRGDPSAFLRARLREGHESIIEHAGATFEVGSISRACSHQLVRHRIASYSQESQRYVDMSEPDFIVPPAMEGDAEALAAWEEFAAEVQEAYARLRARGVRKEDARFVLPNATSTRIVVTMNFRSLRHFFKLRIAPEAQWEIRALAMRMLDLLVPHAPTVFRELREELRQAHPVLFEGRG